MALIPEQTIEQIRESNDIVDVVSEYVQLKRSGRNYFGRCPFHDEKTPSFSVSPDKQIYHCFGCGAGGNVINFVMEHERLDFLSAVKLLAERANIKIETSTRSDAPRDDQAHYYNLHELAARIYERTIFDDQGKEAHTYMVDRGFKPEVLKKFRVGFAPDQWETLTLEAMKLGLSKQILERSGLLMSRNDGSFYDRFRGRIMFPIANNLGKVQAFGGRVFGDVEGAKYMNSPETPIYHKGRTLYGLHISKDPMRKTRSAVLVEGYLDLIRLHQEGFENVVAGTGTAFTRQQAAIVKRFADKVFICYDSDDAGRKAAQRSGLALLEAGLETRIIALPADEDPDSYFDEHEPAAFETLQEEARDYIPFIIDSQREQLGSTTAKANFIRSFVTDLAQIENNLLREMLAGQLAEELGVSETNVMQVLHEQLRRSRPGVRRTRGEEKLAAKKPQVSSAIDRAEIELLRMHLSQDTDLLEWLTSTLDADDIGHLRHPELFQLLRGRLRKEFPINRNRLLDDVESADLRRLLTRLIAEVDDVPESLKLAGECVRTIRHENIKRELDALRESLRNTECEGGDISDLMKQISDLKLKQSSL